MNHDIEIVATHVPRQRGEGWGRLRDPRIHRGHARRRASAKDNIRHKAGPGTGAECLAF